jgi:hypothetical protein
MIEQHNNFFKEFKEMKSRLSLNFENQILSNTPNEKQQKAYISYETLLDIKNSLQKGSQKRLLFSMYLLIPPVRANYGNMKIYKKNPHDDEDNYIILSSDKPKIVLNKFKTNGTYGRISIPIPMDLMSEILDSLEKNPRDYLFTLKNGKPFEKKNVFSVMANKILKKETGNKDFNLTMFRHIYLSRPDLDLTNKTLKERKKISDIMGHSANMQERYIWKNIQK